MYNNFFFLTTLHREYIFLDQYACIVYLKRKWEFKTEKIVHFVVDDTVDLRFKVYDYTNNYHT